MKRVLASMCVCVHKNKQSFLQLKNVEFDIKETLLELPTQ